MPKITTFLTYVDQAEPAAQLYTSIFPHSKITDTTHFSEAGPLPMGTVMTVAFELDGQPFIALNGGPHFQFSQAISLSVSCETQAEIDEYSDKLIAGGGEQGPCGWLTDRFGVSWQVNPSILLEMLGDEDPARSARVMRAMMDMHRIDIAALERAYAG